MQTDVLKYNGTFPICSEINKKFFYWGLTKADEAQNTTPAQMKMFLTRIGFGSKVVITGNATQKDLPPDAKSGLDVALRTLKNVEDFGFCEFTSKDVVRHPLVQKIVNAYEDYGQKQSERKKRKRQVAK